MNRARAETCSVEEKYMTEKLFRCLLKRSENIKTSSLDVKSFKKKTFEDTLSDAGEFLATKLA